MCASDSATFEEREKAIRDDIEYSTIYEVTEVHFLVAFFGMLGYDAIEIV